MADQSNGGTPDVPSPEPVPPAAQTPPPPAPVPPPAQGASPASMPGDVPKSKTTAGLLAIFLGALGIHRFYLGFTTLGIVMVCISVLSLFILAPFVALWGIIDGILIFTDTIDKDAQGVPLV
jgi:TM2 domain-containing membrane protein YozV